MSLKVGLLGAGRIGHVHAKAISRHADSELAAVSDMFSENAQSVAQTFGCSVRTTGEIIADPDIDAVLIATPTDTHAFLIEAAVDVGKAVLCEKPVDLSLDRAVQCLNHVEAKRGKVMVGFNRRFDPNFHAMQNSLVSGEIGKPELMSITSFDPAPPPVEYIKVSGGIFRDMMIHDFDMASFLMGDMPETISAKGSCVVDEAIGKNNDFDTAVVTLTYKDGRLAVIKNSRRAVYGYDQRVEILGSKGLLQAQNVLENTVVKSTENGVSSAKPTYFFLERYMDAYEAEWNSFVHALNIGSDLPVTLKDGVAALEVAEAASQSAQTGESIRLHGS